MSLPLMLWPPTTSRDPVWRCTNVVCNLERRSRRADHPSRGATRSNKYVAGRQVYFICGRNSRLRDDLSLWGARHAGRFLLSRAS